MNSPLFKISLRNGLIAGFLGFIVLLVLYFMGKHPFLFNVFFDFRIILFAIFMVITLRELRDLHQEGILFFWQGMIACFLFTITFAIAVFFLLLIWIKVYPVFLASYVELAIEQYNAFPPEAIKQIGKETFEGVLVSLKNMSAFVLAKRYFWQNFIISFFVSIIISVILRRQPKID
jgi:Protein of unknown function (DUF4199)